MVADNKLTLSSGKNPPIDWLDYPSTDIPNTPIQDDLEELRNEIDKLNNEVNGLKSSINEYVTIGVISIIIAVIAFIYLFSKLK